LFKKLNVICPEYHEAKIIKNERPVFTSLSVSV